MNDLRIVVDENGMVKSHCSHVWQLGLAAATEAALEDSGVRSIKELQLGMLAGEISVSKIPGLTTARLREVREALSRHGIKIRPTAPERICCDALGWKFQYSPFLERPFPQRREAELYNLAQRCLQTEEFKVFQLVYLEDLQKAAIAARMSYSLTTAQSVLSRMKHRLRCWPMPDCLKALMRDQDPPMAEWPASRRRPRLAEVAEC